MVTVAAASLRRRFLDQTRRVVLALWQLRQLVPKVGRAGTTRPSIRPPDGA
jgi:hypothetical protein